MIIIILKDISEMMEFLRRYGLEHEIGVSSIIEEAATFASGALLFKTGYVSHQKAADQVFRAN